MYDARNVSDPNSIILRIALKDWSPSTITWPKNKYEWCWYVIPGLQVKEVDIMFFAGLRSIYINTLFIEIETLLTNLSDFPSIFLVFTRPGLSRDYLVCEHSPCCFPNPTSRLIESRVLNGAKQTPRLIVIVKDLLLDDFCLNTFSHNPLIDFNNFSPPIGP